MAHKKYLTKEDKNKSLAENNSKYWKTRNGKLMMTYNNMNRRVRGYVKSHIYKDLELLSREDFYNFSLCGEVYHKLYEDWVNSEYDRKLSPSIDRIDSSKGYVLGNIQWITHSENSRLGSISRWANVKMDL